MILLVTIKRLKPMAWFCW